MEWIGYRARFAAYRKLVGDAFELATYLAASAGRRDAFAGSLAEFLAAMHSSFDADEIERLGIPAVGDDKGDVPDPASLAALPRHLRPAATAALAEHHHRWANGSVPGPDVVLHNDFHLRNLVLAGLLGPVCGVWDFSCVAVGRPTFDLRYFAGDSLDLLTRIAAHYERLSGRKLDVAAAITANRAEIVSDAIETADMTELSRAVEQRDDWRY